MPEAPSRPRSAVVVACFIGGLLAGGCGPRTGSMSGKVMYKGQPVTSGQVSLLGPDHTPRYADITEDGQFTFPDLPVGECKVAVASPGPSGGKSRRGEVEKDRPREPGREDTPVALTAAQQKSWRPIPEKYLLHTTSSVTVTVVSGKSEKNIELPD